MRALVERGDLEGAARARGGLLEDEREVLAPEPRLLVAAILGRLELRRELEQEHKFLFGEIEFLQEIAVAKIDGHVRQLLDENNTSPPGPLS